MSINPKAEDVEGNIGGLHELKKNSNKCHAASKPSSLPQPETCGSICFGLQDQRKKALGPLKEDTDPEISHIPENYLIYWHGPAMWSLPPSLPQHHCPWTPTSPTIIDIIISRHTYITHKWKYCMTFNWWSFIINFRKECHKVNNEEEISINPAKSPCTVSWHL